MNILFLTMSQMRDIDQRGIYTDLMRMLKNEGHQVYIISPCERREGFPTTIIESDSVHVLSVKTLNVKKTNVIEKGLGQLSLEYLYKKAIKKYFKNICFDLILYSTPPITFPGVITYAKKSNPKAKTYLLLKDIFPQNAVDLGMLSKTGIKGLLYRYFRRKEKRLYALSDYIGCMSPANVKYVIKYNPEIDPKKVEIAPNSFEKVDGIELPFETRMTIRRKFHLPESKPVFIYGGNLGKPQGIPFLLECLQANMNREDCYFVIIGNGTEYSKIETWINKEKPKSVSLLKSLPKKDYDELVGACDVGLIFLDYRFSIPNYPSRLLTYLMNQKPIIAATDSNSDIGSIAEKNDYGYWCPSNSVELFTNKVNKMLNSDIKQMGKNGYKFCLKNYSVENTYDAIIKHFIVD